MLSIFVNSWKLKEVRAKILYTIMILLVIRLGAHIALPGIDVALIKAKMAMDLQAMGGSTLYNIISGGANSSYSIFAMGIGPYITSSIIMQLLTVAIPKLEQLNKEGEEGRKKIQSYSRYLTVVLATIQGIGVVYTNSQFFYTQNKIVFAVAVITIVSGSTFIMWLAEQITAKGITNGSSMVIFVNIVSSLPVGINGMISYATGKDGGSIIKVMSVILALLIVLIFIVYVHDGERRIPVQYSSKTVGRRQVGGQSTFMPIKVNTAGVISIIFAISLLQFPETIGQFIPGTGAKFEGVMKFLSMTSYTGAAIYVVLIIAFSYFYTSITINPIEISENMKKNGGFIPGIRPGQPTSNFISRVVNRITFVGAISYSLLAIVPIVLGWVLKMEIGFGGTTLIIVVGVALDIVKALESQLLMRHYKGFLND